MCIRESVSGTSYPLFSSDDIIWKKKDNNIYLKVSDEFRDTYVTVTAASTLYALQQDLANFETTVSMLSGVYESITDFTSFADGVSNTFTSYLTLSEAKAFYQPLGGMGSYVTVDAAAASYQPVANMSRSLTSASIPNTLNSYFNSYDFL